ncbi:hypothetical protein L6R29_06245 [Myxococcota bacterium]|nr:hypothetical protein [Myxococcota bacterium]
MLFESEAADGGVAMFSEAKQIHEQLEHLADALELEGAERLDLVVCGGAGLQVLGLVERATRDVDVVARVVGGKDCFPEPFSEPLLRAVQRVAEDDGLPKDWLNAGPAENQRLGLPEGLLERCMVRVYGALLTVRFLSRYDQIHFKLYATVDSGVGKHLDDLRLLEPNAGELKAAALWSMTHDPSEGYKQMLLELLDLLGFMDVANELRG